MPAAAPAPAPARNKRARDDDAPAAAAAPEASKRQKAEGDPFSHALNGRRDAVAAALDADPSLIDQTQASGLFRGKTLLHLAASRGHGAVVDELLRRGADASACDPKGQTAAALARKHGDEALAARLEGGTEPQIREVASAPAPAARSKRGREEDEAAAEPAAQRPRVVPAAESTLSPAAPAFVPSPKAPVEAPAPAAAAAPVAAPAAAAPAAAPRARARPS